MKISVAVLREAMNKLLEHAEKACGGEIELEEELYWFIQREDVYDPTKDPTDISLGCLDDDWGNLEEVAEGKKDAIGYDLVWSASILRALGERIV